METYHAHIYFEPDQIETASSLVERVKTRFPFEIGRLWDKPVGPHPIGSCQITVPEEKFGEFIPWLMVERRDLTVFVHKNTGDDLRDHTQLVLWLGKSYPLKISMFEQKDS